MKRGWHDDPWGQASKRWHDGSHWTKTLSNEDDPGPPEELTFEPYEAPADESDGAQGGRKEQEWYARPLAGWKLWAALVGALIVGVGIGVASAPDPSELDDLNAQVAALQDDLSSTQDELASTADERDAAQEEASRAKEQARTADERAKTAAEKAIASQQEDLDAREAQLDSRQADIDQQVQTIKDNTITDGIWQVGVDFEPGLYRAPGGGLCYWARLNSADTGDIADNGLGKNPTVQLDSGFFETQDCGEWTKIG
jgi:hypothetical protein